jgi:hypothetical protein
LGQGLALLSPLSPSGTVVHQPGTEPNDKVVNLRDPGTSVDFLGYTFRYDLLMGRGHRLNVTRPGVFRTSAAARLCGLSFRDDLGPTIIKRCVDEYIIRIFSPVKMLTACQVFVVPATVNCVEKVSALPFSTTVAPCAYRTNRCQSLLRNHLK